MRRRWRAQDRDVLRSWRPAGPPDPRGTRGSDASRLPRAGRARTAAHPTGSRPGVRTASAWTGLVSRVLRFDPIP
eukprot:176242-Pyramimonas_sp.AAC.1